MNERPTRVLKWSSGMDFSEEKYGRRIKTFTPFDTYLYLSRTYIAYGGYDFHFQVL
ncbi:hypothetical protein STEG23_035943, partial [Scotinomys teguina]